jgi:hypothetical protein
LEGTTIDPKHMMESNGAERAAESDRRVAKRYPIASDLSYILVRRGRVVANGRGRLLDMSSGGILFEGENPLPLGFSIELIVPWPSRMSGALELLVCGRIVRTEGARTAIAITRHEFRQKRGWGSTPAKAC